MYSDPIADMLTRVRNAARARHTKVEIPCSRVKLAIAKILQEEGYIHSFKKVEDDKQGLVRIQLKRSPRGDVITGIKRVSRPGCRIYVGKKDIPEVEGGLGINILTTPKGVMTGRQATKEGVGGEILCDVW